MGCWGTGIFDDDSAYNFVDEIKEDAFSFFHISFEKALQTSYLEYSDCHAVTVSGAYLDNFLNQTQYYTEGDYEEYNVNDFHKMATLPSSVDIGNLLDLAVEALPKVISEASELHELASEDKDGHYEEWKKVIEDLIKRLQKAREVK